MTKDVAPETNVLAGIAYFLADHTNGRRSVRWLSERTGIKRSTLNDKLTKRPGRLNTEELALISNALGVTEVDIYRAGKNMAGAA